MKGPAHTSEVYFRMKLRADVLGYMRLSAAVVENCVFWNMTLVVHWMYTDVSEQHIACSLMQLCLLSASHCFVAWLSPP
jgi:hypothetical protein